MEEVKVWKLWQIRLYKYLAVTLVSIGIFILWSDTNYINSLFKLWLNIFLTIYVSIALIPVIMECEKLDKIRKEHDRKATK